MLQSLTHPPAQLRPRTPTGESGLEIIDTGLERNGILPVQEITITDSGLAIYRIRNSATNGSLEQAIKNGRLSWVEATRAALDALRVVSEMHDDRELEAHGDISPKNIFIDNARDTAAISGFHNSVVEDKALAIPALKAVLIGHHHSDADQPHLEPAFTAPEIINGGQPDSKSDVYEAGRTLFYGLHGRALGATVEYEEFMDRLDPVPPPELSGDFPTRVPNGIRFVIQGALDPDPTNRPTMNELVNEAGEGLHHLEAAA